MQRILLGLLALFLVAACSTPQATAPTTMSDKPAMAPMSEDFRATPPKPGPAPEIKLGDFQDFKLDNGLQVVLVENHKLPRVSYQLFIDVPTHSEGEYAGAGDMMGDMLRRATSSKSKEEIDEAIDFIGANLSTSGGGAFASTISKYKEQMMEMMAEVVLDARFPEAEFEKVKSDALAGLKASLASPDAIASRIRQKVYYGNHPFGELTTEETLNKIDLATIKNYYDTYFVPNRSYLVMVGDLTRAEAEQLAKKHFAAWESKGVPQPKIVTPKRPDGVTVNFVPRAGSVQSTIVVGHPVELQPGTTKAIRARLVNSVLGGGVLDDRLTRNLREDKAYTYSPGSSLSSSQEVGNFRASANVRNEVTDSAVTEILYE
ncbi:MAG: pitrilysin family protein, partial [Bacteroidota bacterium]